MDERMIFENTIYRFEFLNETKKQMLLLGMTIDDIKDAFLKEEEQKEYFASLEGGDATFVFCDLKENSIVASKKENLIEIIDVY